MAKAVKVAFLLYPFLVLALLAFGDAEIKRIACAVVLAACLIFCVVKFILGNRPRSLRKLLPPLVLASLLASVLMSGNENFFKLYPIIISGLFLFQFAWSLYFPPTVVERIARLTDKSFTDAAIPYAQKVTLVWCGFFIFNIAVSVATAFASWNVWALYNGLISYILIGALFVGERIVRSRIKRRASSNTEI